MNRSASPSLDPLTAATVTTAWVICANKPFYPLYVWWLVGNGVMASLATIIAAPLFAAIPFIARRSPLAARVALPVVGTLDTLLETKLFGQAAGTELFLAACIMLAALSFHPEEKNWRRAIAVAIFLAFAAFHDRYGAALHVWSAADLATLFNLNAFAVASLTVFIALRYAGVARQPPT